jgi:hypothetical protein
MISPTGCYYNINLNWFIKGLMVYFGHSRIFIELILIYFQTTGLLRLMRLLMFREVWPLPRCLLPKKQGHGF